MADRVAGPGYTQGVARRNPRGWTALFIVGGLGLLIIGSWLLVTRGVVSLPGYTGTYPATLETLRLPPGFKSEVVASGLDAPRFMTLGPDGAIYITEVGGGNVLRMVPGHAPQVVASGFTQPQGIAFYQGQLYITESGQVLRLGRPGGDGRYTERAQILSLPGGGIHVSRTIVFGPDHKLYISVGSSCNVCDEGDHRRAAILQANPDGSGARIFASGLRNAVGLTWRPGTGELWVSNNGRDLLGDDTPPDTIYQVQDGGNYGWPRCHAGHIVDPDMGQPDSCAGQSRPAAELPAHVAPLGLTFYSGRQFPAEYQGNLFVAWHGSWNRSSPVGYKVVRLPYHNGKLGAPVDFMTGWLKSRAVSGRPVWLTVASDGSLYICDDTGGRIYRVSYTG